MTDVLVPATILLAGLTSRAKRRLAQRAHGDDGVSTLEMVIIALGLVAIATLLVTALTLAVTRRTDQIK